MHDIESMEEGEFRSLDQTQDDAPYFTVEDLQADGERLAHNTCNVRFSREAADSYSVFRALQIILRTIFDWIAKMVRYRLRP